MIKSFSFKNYKAFKEGKIEIKPITILLGANSVGKSSILQFLSMIKQTVNNDKKYKSALKLNGENVSLGENKNIFHNQETKQPLEISFEIDNFDIDKIKKDLENSIEEIFISLERIYSFFTEEKSKKRPIRNELFYRRPELLYRKHESINYFDILKEIQSLKTKINNQISTKGDKEEMEEFLHRIIGHPRYRRNISSFYSKKEKKIKIEVKHYRKIYKLLNSINKDFNKQIVLSYQIISKNKELEINKLEIKKADKILLGYKKEVNKNILFSDVLESKDLKKYQSQFGSSIFFEKLNILSKTKGKKINENLPFGWYKYINKIEDNIFIETIFNIFKKTIGNIKSSFSLESINYVSPLRAFPKRYYFLDEANVNSSLNTINGNQLTEILKEDKNIKKMVNDWLEKFQLKVDVKNLADVIHNIKINQHGLNLDITDVGFGLSQVLPVIVQGFLSQDDSLTIIEQPEIHLHPKMQAELSDLFIDIVRTKKEDEEGKYLLIETHSEYLLKRLRRRIAEGKISSHDVAIYFIHPKDEKTKTGKIEKIEISETGNFEWPKDFYEDSINDTLEFLIYQK